MRTMHTYCKLPLKLNQSVMSLKKQATDLRCSIRNEKRKVIQLKKKVSNLHQIVQKLKRLQLISSTAIDAVEKCCSGIPLAIMRRIVGNKKTITRQKYPDELRRFAMTLQFYSSKAYNYVRKTFNLALPAPSVIRSWMTNIKCELGFTEQAFAALKLQIQTDENKGLVTVCSLMLDEMAIKKQVDFAAGKVWGYVNCGSGLENDELPCATEALVLLVVAVNARWKIPIGYFLNSGLTGNEKANIIKQALMKLHKLKIVITSVTMAMAMTMANHLGAEIKNIDNIVPFFPHPADGSEVFIIFDVCHMLKLLQNAWASDVILKDANNNTLDFNYITKLHQIETSEILRLGTKLKKAHIEWTKQKIKVNLAAQTLSNSVADALEFLRTDVNHPDFKEAGLTIHFLRLVDRVFDLLNSRNPFGRDCKSPLKTANRTYWHPIFMQAIDFFKSCKNINGTCMVATRKKTAFIGFIVAIKSAIGIYNKYVAVQDAPLKYLLTYKLSQDHLELFFCSIRSRNVWNNNSTSYQFYNTYRRLLLHHDVRPGNGNCLSQDSTTILHVTKKQGIINWN